MQTEEWYCIPQLYKILHFMGSLRPKAEHSVLFQGMHLTLN
ncbi:hypothetical protein Nmel_003952 [Mimus melanotis]